MTTTERKLSAYRAGNVEAAQIIVADPTKYPVGSLLALWAALVLNPPADRTKAEIRRAA